MTWLLVMTLPGAGGCEGVANFPSTRWKRIAALPRCCAARERERRSKVCMAALALHSEPSTRAEITRIAGWMHSREKRDNDIANISKELIIYFHVHAIQVHATIMLSVENTAIEESLEEYVVTSEQTLTANNCFIRIECAFWLGTASYYNHASPPIKDAIIAEMSIVAIQRSLPCES